MRIFNKLLIFTNKKNLNVKISNQFLKVCKVFFLNVNNLNQHLEVCNVKFFFPHMSISFSSLKSGS